MEFIPDIPVIEAIVRRHVPACFHLERVELASHDINSGNPAPFRIIASIRRVTADPDPGGWGHALAGEIRAGWDMTEFSIDVRHLPSEFEDTVGRYADDKGAA